MIDHETQHQDGTWGVSHNENGVLLKVCCYKKTDRIRLCEQEVDELIAELEHHKAELLAGAWCGRPMEKMTTRNQCSSNAPHKRLAKGDTKHGFSACPTCGRSKPEWAEYCSEECRYEDETGHPGCEY